jgi:acetyl-CoA carboxylase biotin carboxyl carrier protein
VDLTDVKRLIELLKEDGLSEITLSEGGRTITVRQELSAPPRRPAPRREEQAAEEGTFAVTAPLVGTFYRRRAPDEPPLVETGATVTQGDTLCIIEAMKVMNEIQAERAGRVLRVAVEDGTPVEYGQVLFVLLRL